MQRFVLLTSCGVVAVLAIWLLVEARETGRAAQPSPAPPSRVESAAVPTPAGSRVAPGRRGADTAAPVSRASAAGAASEARSSAEAEGGTPSAAAAADLALRSSVGPAVRDPARGGDAPGTGARTVALPPPMAQVPTPPAIGPSAGAPPRANAAATAANGPVGIPPPQDAPAPSAQAGSNQPVFGGPLTPEQIEAIAAERVVGLPEDQQEAALASARQDVANANRAAMDMVGLDTPPLGSPPSGTGDSSTASTPDDGTR